MKRAIPILLHCALITLLTSSLSAQEVTTNIKGEKITKFEDGSWRYYEAKDSIYLADDPLTEITFDDPPISDQSIREEPIDEWNYRTFQRYVAAAVKYETRILDRVDQLQNSIYDLEDEINLAINEGDSERARILDDRSREFRAQLQVDQKELAASRKLITRILKVGKKSKYEKLANIEVPGLTHPFSDEESSRLVEKSQELTPQATEDVKEPLAINVRDYGDTSEEALPASETKIDATSAQVNYTQVNRMRWSSTGDSHHERTCEFTFDGIDAFTNQPRRELQPELFFSHTDSRIKPYLKEREYMTCHGYLTSIAGGFRYLTLTFRIASRTAQREYGGIRNGGLLNLKLLDGSTISLFSQGGSQLKVDPKTNDIIYRVRYPIDYQKEKLISRSEIDQVRVVWATGYEDYEVYNIDFFMNQLICLNSN